MAKDGGTKWENELLSAKTRSSVVNIEGASYETGMRLYALSTSLKNLGPHGDAELLRHFPVAVIAALETHFKATIQAIVDAGAPYLERGLLMTKDRLKLVMDFYPIVHREQVSVGDLVAHHVPFNSVGSIESAFGVLLDSNFKKVLSSIQDPYEARRDTAAPKIVENIDELWCNLALTFERRHILAHESAAKYSVRFDHAQVAVESALLFTTAVDAVLWGTIWRDRPLTQYELNIDARDRYSESRAIFAKTLRLAYSVAKEAGNRKIFHDVHQRWRDYAKATVSWTEMDFQGGSIRPLVVASDQERLLKARNEDVSVWLSWALPEHRRDYSGG